MLVECISGFLDKAEGINRSKGDRFDATAKRVDEINAAGFGQLVKAVGEPAKAKRTRKASDKTGE